MYRLIEAGNQKNIQLRAIGGLAVRAHDKTHHPLFMREFADLDFVISKKQRRDFEQFMPEAGYVPDKQFNILNGDVRQLYFHKKTELKADIFVGNFEMCHKIPLETACQLMLSAFHWRNFFCPKFKSSNSIAKTCLILRPFC